MTIMTDDEWQKLYENFETTDLLRAVDSIDRLRDDLNDREHGAPPEIRSELLKLHQLAMDVINSGSKSQAAEFFELAGKLDIQVEEMMEALEQVQDTLSKLMELYPESLYYNDGDDIKES